MRHRLTPFVVVLTLILALFTGLAPTGQSPASAQVSTDDGQAAAAAEAAVTIARLEEERDFAAIYDLLHPDSRQRVPRAAVVGWYEALLADEELGALTVTDVVFIDWTWEVTGATYRETAEVSFVQIHRQDGAEREESGVIHLVRSDDGWGWFFGASQEFIDEQIAQHAPSSPEDDGYDSPYAAEMLVADVDEFWADTFDDADLTYLPPANVVGFDQPIETACGDANPREHPAFYCGADKTIYYAVEFRAFIESQLGDFGWVTVLAHEWGHHIQFQLGDVALEPLDLDGELYGIEIELQADCLAGVYTQDAEATGWLDAGDLEEALTLTYAVGDPDGTAWEDPAAHGTGDQRVEAFLNGYREGFPGCGIDL